jgi:SAM-dependent MidA family methyltransferase
VNVLAEKIAHEIGKEGSISFAKFMELALYCPVYGYYEKEEDSPGRCGDFFTSVSVGPLFGQLLAFQFSSWLEALTETRLAQFQHPLRLVEAGAHDGRLAADILQWLRMHRSGPFKRLQYVIIEPSPRRRSWQEARLGQFQGKILWCEDVAMLEPAGGVHGIIFSNELLDAFPVHRLGWDAARRAWFEWAVTLNEGRFVWTQRREADLTVDLQSSWLRRVPQELLAVLPHQFTLEYSPQAEAWWKRAAEVLRVGKLLTIDYGLETTEIVRPERVQGTLRAYRQHRLISDVLSDPGEQDLTAHVNLTAVREAGEGCGLVTELETPQEKLLMTILAAGSEKGEFRSEHTPGLAKQVLTLTRPDHLGRSFQVLVQSRHN